MASVTLDGRTYTVPENFTYRELRLIKTWTGLRAGELEEAMRAGDTDLIVSLAAIAMNREGHTVTIDDLYELEAGTLVFQGDEAEAADPPAGAGDEPAAKPKPRPKSKAKTRGRPGTP